MSIVAALLHEREGYLRAGRMDRARQVEVELARFGIAIDADPEAAVSTPPEKAVQRRPRKR